MRENRTFCLPFDRSGYGKVVADSKEFRRGLDEMMRRFQELFPEEITGGYGMKVDYGTC